jgi:hypothetical protein
LVRYAIAVVQLDKFQKNDIFMAIAEAGLVPEDFELSFAPEQGDTLLNHKRSSASFVIGSEDYGRIWVEYEVADGPRQASPEEAWLPAIAAARRPASWRSQATAGMRDFPNLVR